MSRGTLKTMHVAQVCEAANMAKIAQSETLILGSLGRRSILDARGEEKTAGDGVKWNANFYEKSSCKCSPLFKEKNFKC